MKFFRVGGIAAILLWCLTSVAAITAVVGVIYVVEDHHAKPIPGVPIPSITPTPAPSPRPVPTPTPKPEPNIDPSIDPTATQSSRPAPSGSRQPARMVAVAGSGQSTNVNASYATRLVVRVTTKSGDPIVGARITFRTPTSGASGQFSYRPKSGVPGSVYVATTNSSGKAIAPTLYANATAGIFFVTATTSGTSAVRFPLTNGEPFIVRFGAVTPVLFPGHTPSVIPITISNPNPFTIYITAFRITASNASCAAAVNVRINQVNLSTTATRGRLVIRARASITLPVQGATNPTIQLIETGVNQTAACADEVFVLNYTGQALP